MKKFLPLIAALFIFSFVMSANAVESTVSKTSYTSNSVPLSGDYTVGLSAFNKASGKNIYFKNVLRKVKKETMEVDEYVSVPMENGIEYSGPLSVQRNDDPNLATDMMQAVYARITDAVNDLNANGQSAVVRFLLVDAIYNSETLPIVIQNSTASSVRTLTIQPNTGVASVITGSSATGIFNIATPYVTINGDNIGGSVGKDLTIRNTNFVTNSSVIGFYNYGAPLVPANCTIKNNYLFGGALCSIILTTSGGNYDNVTIDNNQILRTANGIYFNGVSGATSENCKVTNNILGSSVDSLSVHFVGVHAAYTDNIEISGNRIQGRVIGNGNHSADPALGNNGITIGAGSTNAKVFNNTVHDFFYNGNLGYGAFGIVYSPGSNINTGTTQIYNNMICNIKGDCDDTTTGYSQMGFITQGISVYTNGTAAVNIYYNSIYLSGNVLSQTHVGFSACIGISANIGNGSLNIRNNILRNSQGQNGFSPSVLNHAIGVWVAAGFSSDIFSNINYNDYYIDGVRPYTGYLLTPAATLANWRTSTGKDLNSIAGDPKFVSSDNLTIYSGSACVSAGTPIAGITTDIFGSTRNASTPTIGADETPSNTGIILFRLEAIQLTRKDTISVSLRSTAAPYPLIETSKGVYDSINGWILLPLSSAVNGSSYFMTVSHRNSITTWSAAPVTCNFNIIGYDFSAATAQAYGSNMKLVSGKASFFTGDVDRNGLVDLTDVLTVYNAGSIFTAGSYVLTDLNYDGIVDLTDVLFASNNSSAFVQQKNP